MRQKQSTRSLITLIAIITALSVAVLPQPDQVSEAQGGSTLAYGSIAFGSITPQAPVQLYNFNGMQGDLIEVHMRTLSNGLLPFVDLLDLNRQTVASARQDSFAANTHGVQLTLLLPQTGVYSLMIGGTANTTGDYALELDGRSSGARLSLTFGQPLTINIAQNASPQYFAFTTESCPTTLAVLNPSQGTPYTFPFMVKVRDERGDLVAVLRGGDALEDRVTVAQQSGSYEVEVWDDDPALSGTLTLLVTCASEPQQCLSNDFVAPGDALADDANCPDCPPCPGDTSDNPLCAGFGISVDREESGTVFLSWPQVEGANAAIVSAVSDTGTLIYARMVIDILTDVIDFPFWGAITGTFTIHVTVGSEELGYNLCADSVVVNLEEKPTEGEEPAEECTVDMIAPRGTMANGLQTFTWNDVPSASSYTLRIYGQFDAVVANGTTAAPSTSMTIDVSEAAIGLGYGGSNEFYAQIDVFRGGERWCANGVRVVRVP
ncbi:MAG: hypothetical protein HY866_17060 [Chloroflexi bacterium]|nr:hypothetical protein [Chloroflexota bacterium]